MSILQLKFDVQVDTGQTSIRKAEVALLDVPLFVSDALAALPGPATCTFKFSFEHNSCTFASAFSLSPDKPFDFGSFVKSVACFYTDPPRLRRAAHLILEDGRVVVKRPGRSERVYWIDRPLTLQRWAVLIYGCTWPISFVDEDSLQHVSNETPQTLVEATPNWRQAFMFGDSFLRGKPAWYLKQLVDNALLALPSPIATEFLQLPTLEPALKAVRMSLRDRLNFIDSLLLDRTSTTTSGELSVEHNARPSVAS